MRIEISFRWFLRLIGIIVGLGVALLHQVNLPVGQWLWDFRIFGVVPEALIGILLVFGLPWVWPGGK